jgi:hypothetical protein
MACLPDLLCPPRTFQATSSGEKYSLSVLTGR